MGINPATTKNEIFYGKPYLSANGNTPRATSYKTYLLVGAGFIPARKEVGFISIVQIENQ